MLLSLDIPKLMLNANKQNTCGLRARHKLAVLRRCGFKCVNCGGRDNLTIDHKDKHGNIGGNRNASKYVAKDCQVLCVKCHIFKNKNGGKL